MYSCHFYSARSTACLSKLQPLPDLPKPVTPWDQTVSRFHLSSGLNCFTWSCCSVEGFEGTILHHVILSFSPELSEGRSSAPSALAGWGRDEIDKKPVQHSSCFWLSCCRLSWQPKLPKCGRSQLSSDSDWHMHSQMLDQICFIWTFCTFLLWLSSASRCSSRRQYDDPILRWDQFQQILEPSVYPDVKICHSWHLTAISSNTHSMLQPSNSDFVRKVTSVSICLIRNALCTPMPHAYLSATKSWLAAEAFWRPETCKCTEIRLRPECKSILYKLNACQCPIAKLLVMISSTTMMQTLLSSHKWSKPTTGPKFWKIRCSEKERRCPSSNVTVSLWFLNRTLIHRRATAIFWPRCFHWEV